MGVARFEAGAFLERAKWGPPLESAELAAVAAALQDPAATYDPYTLIHILGRSGAVTYRGRIETYLDSPADPMLARIALKVLCDFWGYTSDYLPQVVRFVEGVPWDLEDGSQVRQIAMTILGRHLAEHPDLRWMELLVGIAQDADEWEPDNENAVIALAYALGIGPLEMPPASRRLDLESVWALGVLDRVIRIVRGGMTGSGDAR